MLGTIVTFNITKENMMEELMQTLVKLYENPSSSNKVFLMKHIFNMKMEKGGDVADHLNEFNTITSQISFVGVNFDEEIRAVLILCSLLESWNSLVMVVVIAQIGPYFIKILG